MMHQILQRFDRKTASMAALVGVFLVFAGCTTLVRSESPKFFGIDVATEERQDPNVLFVLDVSGSMMGRDEGAEPMPMYSAAVDRTADVAASLAGLLPVGDARSRDAQRRVRGEARHELSKMGAAQRELVPAIRGLPEGSRFSVISFGHTASHPVLAWEEELVPATEENRESAASYVRELEARGGTPALTALERAFEFEDVEVVFFLSDGRPTDARAERILERVRELNEEHGVITHTVGLGTDQDENFMAALAQENGGLYATTKHWWQ